MEQTPTYKRTRDILDSIYSQASGEEIPKSDVPQSDIIQGTIKFS